MKITIYVPQEIEIPDDEVARLEESTRELFELEADAEIVEEDLISAAIREGVIADLPRGWHVD